MKKRIVISTKGDVTNPKTWSRTPYSVFSEFQKEKDFEVIPFNSAYKYPKLIRVFLRYYSKIFFLHHRNYFTYRKIARVASERLAAIENVDAILFISEYFYSKEIPANVKLFSYNDADLKRLFSTMDEENKKLLYNFEVNYSNKCSREALTRMTAIFTMNEWTKQEMISMYGIDPNIIYNVGFGVNCSFLDDEKRYDEDLLLIVLRKGTEHYKGLDLLLEAFPLIRKKVPNVKLAVVGTDKGSDIEGVTCYYNQPREVTLDLFKRCTLYVMPALSEANGITYLEALANKAPVVGLNRFSLPEFLGEKEERGFLVENADPKEVAEKVVYALSDKQKLKRMGIDGQQFVKNKYSWDIVVKKMIDVIKQS